MSHRKERKIQLLIMGGMSPEGAAEAEQFLTLEDCVSKAASSLAIDMCRNILGDCFPVSGQIDLGLPNLGLIFKNLPNNKDLLILENEYRALKMYLWAGGLGYFS